MNNPLSVDPRYALFPAPANCTGYRLWKMLQSRDPTITRKQYLDGFDRRNVLSQLRWDGEAAGAAADLIASVLRGRVVLALGDSVRKALGAPRLLLHPQEWRGVTLRQLPHPSGRCRWYNDPVSRDLAATLLHELYLSGER